MTNIVRSLTFWAILNRAKIRKPIDRKENLRFIAVTRVCKDRDQKRAPSRWERALEKPCF
jgi:hypothetical protein